MYSRPQIALWSVAAIFSLAFCCGEAASKAAPTKSATNANYGQVLSELHQAKHLLDHANHTYNGHRAKADHEIAKAIHILHYEHHKKSGTTAKSTAHAKTGQHKTMTESQQASDTELRQAEKLVRAALLELHKHHHDHKAKEASKLLHQAIHEIELAMHLHHKHHSKNQVAKS